MTVSDQKQQDNKSDRYTAMGWNAESSNACLVVTQYPDSGFAQSIAAKIAIEATTSAKFHHIKSCHPGCVTKTALTGVSVCLIDTGSLTEWKEELARIHVLSEDLFFRVFIPIGSTANLRLSSLNCFHKVMERLAHEKKLLGLLCKTSFLFVDDYGRAILTRKEDRKWYISELFEIYSESNTNIQENIEGYINSGSEW